jgi:predicted TIM-barrel fold metal-dependent hydrolase
VGCEGGEHNLADVIRTVGHSPFFYSSDFPHEVTDESCRQELGALAALDVSYEDRQLTLAGNADSYYKL